MIRAAFSVVNESIAVNRAAGAHSSVDVT
jgi:hypothetical protein